MTPKKQIRAYVAPAIDELIRIRTQIDPLKRSMSDITANYLIKGIQNDPLLAENKKAILLKINTN